jgi:Na+-transporting methylmalonyl-CoA/oxaloacetate decarboxylase gamma subunit
MLNAIKEFKTTLLNVFTLGITGISFNLLLQNLLLLATLIYTIFKIVTWIKQNRVKKSIKKDINKHINDGYDEFGDSDRQD